MSQLFQPNAVLFAKLGIVAVAGVFAYAVVQMLIWVPEQAAPTNAPVAQPIPFSHKHHVGDVGLDCRFCHVTVEKTASPGMPSAQLCLTCHSQLFADQPVFEPLRRALAGGQPIAWTQVHRLPDYVYFDHSVHVAKGVACVECHGRVDQMALTRSVHALSMKWCVACHQDPAPHLHPAEDVFRMPTIRLSDADVSALARLMQIESRQRMTDCSTCHR